MRTLPELLAHRPHAAAPQEGPVDGPASGEVRAWGGRATVTVDDPAALAPAMRLARHHLRSVARACDRHDPGAPVHLLPAAAGQPVMVGTLLLRHVRAALETAATTDGLVDPTAVSAHAAGSGPALPVCSHGPRPRAARGWQSVQVTDSSVQVPGGTALDLTASALPQALDDVARVVAQLTGTGVRVRLHGRTAWCDASACVGGTAATDGRRVVDPRTGQPARSRWSWVQVSADSARSASALAVAAVVLGDDAPRWLQTRGASAHLVRPDGEVVVVGEPGRPQHPSGPARRSLRATSAA